MNLNILAKLMTFMWKKLKKNLLDLKLGKIILKLLLLTKYSVYFEHCL